MKSFANELQARQGQRSAEPKPLASSQSCRPNLFRLHRQALAEIHDNIAARRKKAEAEVEAVIAAVIKERRCVYCGCTEIHACEGGCEWLVIFPHGSVGVCSNERCLQAFSKDCQEAAMRVLGRPNSQTISKI